MLKSEILQTLLKKYMYPFLERVARQDLTENAEKSIAQACGSKFKEMINLAPYTKYDENDKPIGDIKVMSLIPDD
jgi:transcriptional accessory protein Tex/SPT6